MVALARDGCDGEFTDKLKIRQLMTGSPPLLFWFVGESLSCPLVAANSLVLRFLAWLALLGAELVKGTNGLVEPARVDS